MTPINGLSGFGGGPTSLLTSVVPPAPLATFDITSVTWYLSSAVSSGYLQRGLNISIYHSSSINGTSFTILPGTLKNLVYSDNDTTTLSIMQTIGEKKFDFGTGDKVYPKSNVFNWNGTNDVVVETCTAQNLGNYSTEGGVRYYSPGATGRLLYYWTDSAGSSCADTPSTSSVQMPSIKLEGTGFSFRPGWNSNLTTGTTSPSPFNVYYRRNITRSVYQASELISNLVT